MRMKLIIQVSEQTGLSCVKVSHEDMWELVEQLSNQRAAVTYTYHEDHFTVTFLHLDAAVVQPLLDDWNPCECSVSEPSVEA